MRTKRRHAVTTSLLAGAAGAVALTILHESVRRATPRAPRMDILGERAIAKLTRAAGRTPPRGRALHELALGGDLVANSVYYALAGPAPGAWLRGPLLGLLAGVGAVILPPKMGLGRAPRGLTFRTKMMTVAYYLFGGVVAAAASHFLSRGNPAPTRRRRRSPRRRALQPS
jgi:hypothetical protein